MTAEEIKSLCINSSKVYYDYLNEKDKGRSVIDINSITLVNADERIVKLNLSRKVFEFDAIVFLIVSNNQKFDTNSIKIIEYDYDKNILLVQPNSELVAKISTLSPDNLKIVSDLKFLVKRVEAWYEKKGSELSLPVTSSILKGKLQNLMAIEGRTPSQSQLIAIKKIFDYPFTYIWGAPGTGKTQLVLSHSIIQYIKAGKKIGIFAPTNNAIEQVLNGVLSTTLKADIDNKQILRLGAPSKEFADRFPEVCEAKGIIKKIEELDKQIKIVENQIAAEMIKQSINDVKQALSLFPSIEQFQKNRGQILIRLDAAEKELVSYKSILDRRKNNIREFDRKIEKIEKKIDSWWYKIKLHFIRSLSKEQNELYSTRLELAIQKGLHENEFSQVTIANHGYNKLRFEYDDISVANRLFSQIKILCSKHGLSKQNADGINLSNYIQTKQNLETVLFKIKQENITTDALAHDYSSHSKEELDAKLAELKNQRSFLESQTTEERLKTVNVVAATLDCYIGRFLENDLSVDHIFLDEAGYANIIKALSLFRKNIPVTFLGDHKQLPPVCEMNDSDMQNNAQFEDVFVWSQSSIYVEDLFLKTRQQACLTYFSPIQQVAYNFQAVQKVDLKETHRFDKKLAAVLDIHIYKNGFTSTSNKEPTKIYYVDVPYFYPQPNDRYGKVARANEFEAREIKKLMPFVQKNNFSILTPYTKQIICIGEFLPEEKKEHKILTVHGSQGKEWDDVILSVVDTNKMWFTNSLDFRTRGANVINTAVSRAKKRLFIVCNYSYWMTQDNQLVKELLNVGEPWG